MLLSQNAPIEQEFVYQFISDKKDNQKMIEKARVARSASHLVAVFNTLVICFRIGTYFPVASVLSLFFYLISFHLI